jgi:hypothetical protein
MFNKNVDIEFSFWNNLHQDKLFNNGATRGAGTVYPSGKPEFTPVISLLCVPLCFTV